MTTDERVESQYKIFKRFCPMMPIDEVADFVNFIDCLSSLGINRLIRAILEVSQLEAIDLKDREEDN